MAEEPKSFAAVLGLGGDSDDERTSASRSESCPISTEDRRSAVRACMSAIKSGNEDDFESALEAWLDLRG